MRCPRIVLFSAALIPFFTEAGVSFSLEGLDDRTYLFMLRVP